MASMLNEIDRNEADLVHVPTVEQAERDLQAHLANFPGDYFTCYRENRLGIRRDWLIRRDSLEGALKMAEFLKSLEEDRRRALLRMRVVRPSGHQPKETFRKTVDQFVVAYERAVEELQTCPRKEWRVKRHAAQRLACKARERAKADKISLPPMTPLPGLREVVRVLLVA